MPTYRYRCDACGDELEVRQSFQDEPLRTHDADGGTLRKVLSPAGIVLKGSGFYKTDSRSGNGARKDGSREKSSEPKESKDSGASKDSKGSSDGGAKTPSSGDSKAGSTSSSKSSKSD
jgi:putative FmdB family regulatory protein